MSTIADVLAKRDQWAIVLGDNLDIMRGMPAASVHLSYLDAPFMTGDVFTTKDGRVAYTDRWPSLEAFVEHVIERCAAARDLLTDDGALILHVDPSTSHYLKVALDRLFGRDCYRNEIIWRYRRWPSKSRDFQRMHDVLFRYTKSPDKERWNQLYEPLAPSTVETWGEARQEAVKEDGKRVRSASTEDPSPGVPMSDVWDIGVLAPVASERTGYPTQKPRSLLDRIVTTCSLPGDVLLEGYCGSAPGVSAAVAHARRGIGLDSSTVAVEIATKRLRAETKQIDWLSRMGVL